MYKSEKYLRRCIDSVVSQTLDNIEVICINDGSPDNSLEILNEYAKSYNNVVVINKKNEGVWKARIDGIKKATGEYIGFLDSDDYLDKNFTLEMYKSAKKNNSDIVVCGFNRIDNNSQKILSREMKFNSNRTITLKNNPHEVISINTSLWNKIYKASLLKDIKEIKNPPRILEDMMLLTLIYLNINKISFVDKFLYNYMVIQGSAMNTLKNGDIDIIKKSMLLVKEEYTKMNVSRDVAECLSSIVFLHLGISLMLSVYKNDRKNFKAIYKDVNQYLDENFKSWKSTKYTTILYNLIHKNYNMKVAVLRKVYKLNLLKVFFRIYTFFTKKLSIDIKW